MESIIKTARTLKGKRIKSYPKIGNIMVAGKLVVLVTGYGNSSIGYPCFSGVVLMEDRVINENTMPVGYYSRTWTLDSFEKTELRIHLH